MFSYTRLQQCCAARARGVRTVSRQDRVCCCFSVCWPRVFLSACSPSSAAGSPCNDTLFQVEVDGQTIEEYVELEKKIASAEAFRWAGEVRTLDWGALSSPALILQQKKDQLGHLEERIKQQANNVEALNQQTWVNCNFVESNKIIWFDISQFATKTAKAKLQILMTYNWPTFTFTIDHQNWSLTILLS